MGDELSVRVDDLQTRHRELAIKLDGHDVKINRLVAAMRVHITKHRDTEQVTSVKKEDKKYFWAFLGPVLGGVSGGVAGWILGHFSYLVR